MMQEITSREQIKQMLRFQYEAGYSTMLEETPQNRLQPPPAPEVAKAPPQPEAEPMQDTQKLAQDATTLAELEAVVRQFEGCALKKTAKNTVFADGNPASQLMIVGEAPGRDEDIQGKPFVGISGQLLDTMLSYLGYTRENFYITNVLPWRPPANRTPSPEEIALCLDFVKRHIALVKPQVVLLVGNIASKSLLNTQEGITRMRGQWHELNIEGQKIPALATFHPAYLLRTPIRKREVWHDLCLVAEKLEELKG